MIIKDIIAEVNKIAPLEFSKSAIDNGAYDNSGLLIDMGGETKSVVFTLDLCDGAVDLAIEKGAKLIVTHHPAIYRPIKNIKQSPIARCIANGISVCSMHLNLDMATDGVEDSLAKLAGAKSFEVLEVITEEHGFGRLFSVDEQPLESYVNTLIGALNTTKYMLFNGGNKTVKKVATFCGAGLNEGAIIRAKDADLLISADVSHHVVSFALDQGKSVLQLTHYASEYPVLKKLCETLTENLKINGYVYVDYRFL